MKIDTDKHKGWKMLKTNMKTIAVISVFALLAAFPAISFAQEKFATPEQAVDALIAANRCNDKDRLLEILGNDAEKLINSGDEIADEEGREKFVAAYDIAHKLESQNEDKRILIIGAKKWEMPIPLIRKNGKWIFDSAAGEQEILNRRIGRNELNVIKVCREFVKAEREYAETHQLSNGKSEYAQHFISHKGKHDGLYWQAAEGEQESPLGPLIAAAQAEGYSGSKDKHRQPYHGYYYKILTGQSAQASGGELNYIVAGHMTEGFALLAFPAKYGDSGVMTFIVNQNGIVHEKDLGSDTAKIVRQIKQYNPDDAWKFAD